MTHKLVAAIGLLFAFAHPIAGWSQGAGVAPLITRACAATPCAAAGGRGVGGRGPGCGWDAFLVPSRTQFYNKLFINLSCFDAEQYHKFMTMQMAWPALASAGLRAWR